MKFVVERGALAAALTRGGRIVRRGNTIPELNHVKIEARQDSAWLTTTDMDSEFTIQVEAGVARPGATTVDQRALAGFVGLVPEGAQVEMDLGDDGARLTARAGRSRANFHTLPASGFPQRAQLGEAPSFTIAGKDLARALGRVAHAISNEETRYYLNGIYMHGDQGRRLSFIATDGHRLALAHATMGEDLPDFTPPIIPRSAVGELMGMAGAADAVELSISESGLRAEIPGTVFLSKLIDGTFPDYERVIPRSSDHEFETARAELMLAARRVAVASEVTKTGRAIKISTGKGLLTLSGKGDAGQIDDEIEARCGGDPTESGLNIAYLIAALDAFDGNPIHCRHTIGMPFVFTEPGDDSHLQIVMPMRV